jgi:hypothetical protein
VCDECQPQLRQHQLEHSTTPGCPAPMHCNPMCCCPCIQA